MEWEVVGVIVVLIGLIATVTGPMIKLNSTLTQLATKVENFTNGLEEFKNDTRSNWPSLNESMEKSMRNSEITNTGSLS